jgi:RNA polymerase sigma-70 factor, ECF subfamily
MMLGNPVDAEDALQEVFVRAMRAADSFRQESSPMTWLYRISTNHCLNLIRSAKRRKAGIDRKTQDASISTSVSSSSIEEVAMIREMLPAFDRDTQELAVYYFIDEMNQEEVARILNLSVPTVRKRLKIFVQKAKQQLK